MRHCERVGSMEHDEFTERYVVPARPVIVVDGSAPTALAELLSWESLLADFGDAPVPVFGDLFTLRRIVPLRRYYERYARQAATDENAAAAYLRWYARYDGTNDFPYSDAVFEAIAHAWQIPRFLRSPGSLIPFSGHAGVADPRVQPHPGRGIFISSAGGRTRMHVDPWASDAVLFQVSGRKRFVVEPPDGHSGGSARGLLEPGEVLYIPAGWLHEVDTIEDSVTIGWNFVQNAAWPRLWRHLGSPQGEAERSFLAYFVDESVVSRVAEFAA